jgi:hypothetical protein
VNAIIPVYLEVGAKRVFAAAVDWPGWCRAGRDEATALDALVAYGPRYARAVASTGLGFRSPASAGSLDVVDRVDGDATTDFGAPGTIPGCDLEPVSPEVVRRLQKLLRACWATFDGVAEAFAGTELRKGPRGGGRDLGKIAGHVFGAEASYLTQVGGTAVAGEADHQGAREAFLDALARRAAGELPETGPRGGRWWPAPYAARRAAWHVLDHVWEIEDRAG